MKEQLKFVIVGHVDHGKSTLIGRLLFDTNSLSPDKMEEIKKQSQNLGRDDQFAFILDHLQEERDQGITIDTTQIFFDTEERDYVIIDAPGHTEFVKNMITGASQADAAVLIVSGKEGLQEQTKRHAYILGMLGIRQVIVVINIWTDQKEGAKEIFERVSNETTEFLSVLNIQPTFSIPIVATNGDNIANRSEDFTWYEGITLLEGLNSFKARESLENKPLYFAVQDVYRIEEKRIAVGRVESGVLEKEQAITVFPTKESTFVNTIEKFNQSVEKSYPGESIGITTKDPLFVERGNVICEKGFLADLTTEFRASLFWMNKAPFAVNELITLRCATQEILVNIEIKKKINSSTLEVINEDDQTLHHLEVAEVVITCRKPIVITKFSEIQEMGRFVLVKDENIVAGGICI